jgi:predicted DNA-binding mobile mystery protein A
MKDAIRHLDQRFTDLRPLTDGPRPPKGWLRVIRDALGMTSAQLAHRLGIAQPSVVELEQSEARGTITLKTLERTAKALGCRLVYALVPLQPLSEIVQNRASEVADRKLAAVAQTMRLEDQAVSDRQNQRELKRQLVETLMRRRARLWDET